MQLLTWILVGAAIGGGMGRRLHGNGGYRPYRDVALGIGAGVSGGLLMNAMTVSAFSGTMLTTMIAMIGAVVLAMQAMRVKQRRVYVRAI